MSCAKNLLSRVGGALLLSVVACGGRAEGGRATPHPDPSPGTLSPRVYVTNYGSSDVSAFDLDAATGALRLIDASPFAVPNRPLAIAAAPTSTRLYVADGQVSTFAVNAVDGALTLIGSAKLAEDMMDPAVLVAHPAGKFVYAANCGYEAAGSISAFTVDGNQGLRFQPGPALPLPFCPNGLVITPSGRFLYVSSQYGGQGDVEGFLIDTNTGALAPVADLPLATLAAVAMAIDPTGKHLYVCDQDSVVRTYDIGADGGLAFGASFKVGTGRNPFSTTIDPAGLRLFVANWSDDTVSSYAIDPATGALLEVAGSPFPAGPSPHVATVDASGAFLFVTNQEKGGIRAFAIAESGALSEVTGSPFAAGMRSSAAVALP